MSTEQIVRIRGTILQAIDANIEKHISGEIIVVGRAPYSHLVILMVLALAGRVAGLHLAPTGNCSGYFYCARPLYLWTVEEWTRQLDRPSHVRLYSLSPHNCFPRHWGAFGSCFV